MQIPGWLPSGWWSRIKQQERSTSQREAYRGYLMMLVEIGLLLAAAMIFGARYLKLDESIAPIGVEFHWVTQTHHFWTWVKQCGLCALWNGSERGGFPALADPHGAALHPLVAITTVAFGVINGAKVAVVFSMFLAGAGQWWLGRVLGLGWLPRLWSALLAMFGAHLLGRLENGWMQIVLGTATASFYFPAAIHLARSSGSKAIVILASILAMVLLSGQGYIQIGLAAAAPALFFLIKDSPRPARKTLLRFLMAGALAALLAAPFLVPLLHFLPYMSKPGDPTFSATQPFEYFLLNLVIGDREFYYDPALSKIPTPAHTALYIGWVPVILAILALRLARKEDQRKLLFLACSALIILFAGSGTPLVWLKEIIPAVNKIRNPMLIAPIGVPPLIGIAAYSLDRILQHGWRISLPERWQALPRSLPLAWLIIIPLALNLVNVGRFTWPFLSTQVLGPEYDQIIEELRTPSLQWVEPPFGSWIFIERGIQAGLKYSPGILAFEWKNRAVPQPYRQVVLEGPRPTGSHILRRVAKARIVGWLGNREYAFIQVPLASFPCQAYGTGGYLRVECNAPVRGGRLVVHENAWDGWYAWVDGNPTPLVDSQWLGVNAPPGKHTYEFRYLPWDAALGVLLFLVGAAGCAKLWKMEKEFE